LANSDRIARQTNDAFYEPSLWIQRKVKYNDFTSIGIGPTICQTIDDHEFSVVKTGLHAATFNPNPCGYQIYREEKDSCDKDGFSYLSDQLQKSPTLGGLEEGFLSLG
jgi:hypothetical protein